MSRWVIFNPIGRHSLGQQCEIPNSKTKFKANAFTSVESIGRPDLPRGSARPSVLMQKTHTGLGDLLSSSAGPKVDEIWACQSVWPCNWQDMQIVDQWADRWISRWSSSSRCRYQPTLIGFWAIGYISNVESDTWCNNYIKAVSWWWNITII